MKVSDHILRNRTLSDDTLSLSVSGTTDKLKYGLMFYTKRVPCLYCDCKCRGKLALNDSGKRLLGVLKRIKDRRAQR